MFNLGISYKCNPFLPHGIREEGLLGGVAHWQIQVLMRRCWMVHIATFFKNTKNLFIHIALIPEGDNPRVNPNILKCLLHSPVAKGYRLVVIASRAIVCKTPTHYLILNSLAFARGCVILRSHILFPRWPSRWRLRFSTWRIGQEGACAFGSPWIIVASPSHPDLLPEFRKNLHARSGHSRSVWGQSGVLLHAC